MNKGERKVPNDIAIMMTGVAFFFDLINIAAEVMTVGVGGIVMDIISMTTFSLWFERYDVSLWSENNVGYTLLAAFFDALPFGDLLLPWTIRVGYTAFTERKEIPTQGQTAPTMWRL